MKTKFLWVALLASAALIAQAQAGGHYGGGGGMGGHFAAGPARGGAVSSFHSMPMRSFGGGQTIYSAQRFSPVGMRSPSSAAFHPQYAASNRGALIGSRQLRSGNIKRDRLVALSNAGNRAITNPRSNGTGVVQNQNGQNQLARFGNSPHLTQGGNAFRGNAVFQDRGNSAGQVRHGDNLPANWRNHVVAQHSANWHRDWDRSRDHWWHGHHSRFINGSWVIFDFGFYPWWPYYWYPYNYYAYDYYGYPYGYDPSYYDPGVYQGEEYYDQNSYSDQSPDSTVAAAQQQLARRGYYRGEIDGIFGSETRRAVARYQSNHGLRVTGYLTIDTLQALGLPRVASN